MRKLNGVDSKLVNILIHVAVPVLMFVGVGHLWPHGVALLNFIAGIFLWLFFLFRVWLMIANNFIGFQDEENS